MPSDRDVIDAFHTLYYSHADRTWNATFWRGIPTLKCPLDLWIYQEMLWELRPELILETGTFLGGSALFLADLCELMGQGRVVTIDKNLTMERPHHPRITYVHGSSLATNVIDHVSTFAAACTRVMVILDDDHHYEHVAQELSIYSDLVTVGQYLIVEDTNVNGHPVEKSFGPGPAEAVQEFLAARSDFEQDTEREKFLMTFNPGGYLRRKSMTTE